MSGQIQDFTGISVVSVTSKATRTGRTMYEVVLSNGMTASCFEAGLATKAHSLSGQAVIARLEAVLKNGNQYINLKDIAPAGTALASEAAAFGGGAAPPFGQPAQQGVAFAPQQEQPAAFGAGAAIPAQGDAKEQRIVRGNSLNAATALFGGVYTGQPDVEDDFLLTRVLRFAGAFEHFIKTGQNIAQAAQSAAVQVAPDATPAQVAEAINAVAPGAVQVGAPVEQAAPVAEAQQAEAPAQPNLPW